MTSNQVGWRANQSGASTEVLEGSVKDHFELTNQVLALSFGGLEGSLSDFQSGRVESWPIRCQY